MKTKFKTEVKPSIPKSLAFEKLNKAHTLVWDCLNYEGIDSIDSTALVAILNGLRQQVNTVRNLR